MKTTLRLVSVELPRAVFKREPYVTAITVCEKTTGGSFPLAVLPFEVAGDDPQIPDPEFGAPPVSSTPTVRGTHQLDLAGFAPVTLFEGDPGSWLVCRGAVMDSDGGVLKAGARLDEARHMVNGTSLGLALAEGVGAPGVAASLAAGAAMTVAGLLAANGDAVLCDFEVRLNSVEAMRQKPEEFEVRTQECTVKLAWVVEGEVAPDLQINFLHTVGAEPLFQINSGVAPEEAEVEVIPDGFIPPLQSEPMPIMTSAELAALVTSPQSKENVLVDVPASHGKTPLGVPLLGAELPVEKDDALHSMAGPVGDPARSDTPRRSFSGRRAPEKAPEGEEPK